ncbi:MAG: acyl-CoA thioesterase [Kiritimatiellia bacterium]
MMTTYRLVMPEDMNHYGFLFGGKMLMWIDEVAWIAVSNDYPGARFVTVGMSEVVFRKSVHPKSFLRFETERRRVGRTSVTYHVDVYRRDLESSQEEHVFHTDITFVKVDEAGSKLPLA